ncbi:MAG: tyrosine recombinase XerC, partial [Oscillospiraceae bacterium]
MDNVKMPQSDLQCPDIIREFLFYTETIKGRSKRTVAGYYTDLRTFFRFINLHKGYVVANTEFNKISIENINIEIIKQITLADIYEFLHYVTNERANKVAARSRKVSCIRVFYKYLTVNANLLDVNPVKNLEMPTAKRALPKYLSLEQSLELINTIDGEFKERNYCIITLFLNCGMRLSELVGINKNDIRNNKLKLLGKGNKERIVYLNSACIESLEIYEKYKSVNQSTAKEKNAVFLNRRGNRLTPRRVEQIVDECLSKAGLGGQGYSTHKLRHTAATLLYEHGNVDIGALQQILGHVSLSTTEIYTHVSSQKLEDASQKSP